MAGSSLNNTAINLILFFSLFISTTIPKSCSYATKQQQHVLNDAPKPPPLSFFQSICRGGKESVAKLHFYVHDLLGGPNQTVYEVARSSIITPYSPTSFGQVRVLDNLITAKPDISSNAVGRAQGFITSSDLENTAFTININFVFTSGMHNGSTISILGRNEILRPSRELSVSGGTGMFRFARGYAVTDTHSYDVEKNYGVLEYTIYVAYLETKM